MCSMCARPSWDTCSRAATPPPLTASRPPGLARLCLEYLIEAMQARTGSNCAFIGLQKGKINFHDMRDFDRMIDAKYERPKEQWWLELKDDRQPDGKT